MNRSNTLKIYPPMLGLGKQLFVFAILLSLSACQSTVRTPNLDAGEIFKLASLPEGASASSSIYVRHFHCSNVEKVALSYIAVTAGEVMPIWKGDHKRVAGAQGNGCLLAIFEGSQEKPKALQIDFSFPDGQTTASGEGRLMTLAELSESEERATTTLGSSSLLSWDIPAGAAISMKEPTLVHWQVSFPQSLSVSNLSFESVSEIVEFSRDRPELTFQVVTLKLLAT